MKMNHFTSLSWLICTEMKHVCLNTVPLIKATSGLGFVCFGLYTSRKLNKCKVQRLQYLIQQSLTVGSLCSVLVPSSHKFTFENGIFPLQWRSSLLAWAVFLWAVLPVFTHHATGPEVAGLAAYWWKAQISYCKSPNTLLLVSHSTRVRSCRPSIRLGISNRTQTQWIHWELSLCTACEVGTPPWALI